MSLEKPQLCRTDRRLAGLTPPQRGYYRVAHESGACEPGPTFSLNLSYVVEGPIEVDVLERTLVAMRERHTILRTRFFRSDGRLCQSIMNTEDLRSWQLEQVDLTSLPESCRAAADLEFYQGFVSRPYDLAGGDVMRSALVALSPAHHRLTVSFNHIAVDGESLAVFVDELRRLWGALAQDPTLDPESVLGPAPPQYIDLLDYLERLDGSEAGQQQRRYWTELLHDAPALELPVDLPREAVDARRAECSGYTTFPATMTAMTYVAEDVVASVTALARSERATVYSVLLAAMAAHLHHGSGQEDLAIVSHVHYGHLLGLQGAIGLFANPLVMRIRAGKQPTYRHLIKTARRVVVSAYEHGDCDVLGIARPHSFRLWFNYLVPEKITGGPLEIAPGLIATPASLPSRAAPRSPYDLLLFLRNLGDRYRLVLLYNTELFRPDGANAFVRGYARQIEAMCRDPGATVR